MWSLLLLTSTTTVWPFCVCSRLLIIPSVTYTSTWRSNSYTALLSFSALGLLKWVAHLKFHQHYFPFRCFSNTDRARAWARRLKCLLFWLLGSRKSPRKDDFSNTISDRYRPSMPKHDKNGFNVRTSFKLKSRRSTLPWNASAQSCLSLIEKRLSLLCNTEVPSAFRTGKTAHPHNLSRALPSGWKAFYLPYETPHFVNRRWRFCYVFEFPNKKTQIRNFDLQDADKKVLQILALATDGALAWYLSVFWP